MKPNNINDLIDPKRLDPIFDIEADALHNPPTDEEMMRVEDEWDRQLDELSHKMTKDNVAAKAVGQRLKELREERGMTVKETAEKAGIRPSTLTAIEGGHYNFGIRQAAQVAHALGANIAVVPASERHHDDRRSDV